MLCLCPPRRSTLVNDFVKRIFDSPNLYVAVENARLCVCVEYTTSPSGTGSLHSCSGTVKMIPARAALTTLVTLLGVVRLAIADEDFCFGVWGDMPCAWWFSVGDARRRTLSYTYCALSCWLLWWRNAALKMDASRESLLPVDDPFASPIAMMVSRDPLHRRACLLSETFFIVLGLYRAFALSIRLAYIMRTNNIGSRGICRIIAMIFVVYSVRSFNRFRMSPADPEKHTDDWANATNQLSSTSGCCGELRLLSS